jgi:RNA polymerase sigma-70 factor, ECF subfamily
MDIPTSTPEPGRPGFAAWYGDRWEPSRRLAARLTGNDADGEDIAAAVLVDVWQRWQLTGWPDAPDAYLHRAVRNRVASHLQRRDREREATVRLGQRDRSDQRDPATVVTDRVAVDEVLAELPPEERRTVELRYLADLSGPATARALGLRPVPVRSRIHRSRRRVLTAA